MNKKSEELIREAIDIEVKARISKVELSLDYLGNLWAEWNGRVITGNEFAGEFDRQFREITHKAWQEKMAPKSKVNTFNSAAPLISFKAGE